MSLKKAVSKVLALATCFGLVMGSSISAYAATVTGSSIEVLLRLHDPAIEAYVESGTACVSTTTEGVTFEYDPDALEYTETSYVSYDPFNEDECTATLKLASALTFDGDIAIDIAFSVDDVMYTSSGNTYGFNGVSSLFYEGTASSSSSSSSEETSSSESSAAASEAEVPIPAPVPTFCNNTVTMADGSKVESAVAGQFVSAEAVALVPAGAAKDLKPDTPVLAPLSASYRAAVSDLNAANSPASTATLKAFETATGLSTACALNVNLVDSATTSLATHNAWSAVDNTAGTYAFSAISGGQLTTLYANEAALMVVNLAEGEGDNAMVVGVTSGGTAFVQNDLDTNPDTATFMVLPGSGVYGVLS